MFFALSLYIRLNFGSNCSTSSYCCCCCCCYYYCRFLGLSVSLPCMYVRRILFWCFFFLLFISWWWWCLLNAHFYLLFISLWLCARKILYCCFCCSAWFFLILGNFIKQFSNKLQGQKVNIFFYLTCAIFVQTFWENIEVKWDAMELSYFFMLYRITSLLLCIKVYFRCRVFLYYKRSTILLTNTIKQKMTAKSSIKWEYGWKK